MDANDPTTFEYYYFWMRCSGYDHWDSLRKGIATWQTAMAILRASSTCTALKLDCGFESAGECCLCDDCYQSSR